MQLICSRMKSAATEVCSGDFSGKRKVWCCLMCRWIFAVKAHKHACSRWVRAVAVSPEDGATWLMPRWIAATAPPQEALEVVAATMPVLEHRSDVQLAHLASLAKLTALMQTVPSGCELPLHPPTNRALASEVLPLQNSQDEQVSSSSVAVLSVAIRWLYWHSVKNECAPPKNSYRGRGGSTLETSRLHDIRYCPLPCLGVSRR